MGSSKFHRHDIIEGCTCSDPDRSNSVASFRQWLPLGIVVVWTDGSVHPFCVLEAQVLMRLADAHSPL